MPALSPYKSDLDYSYAPGIFPSMECLLYRPEIVRRLLIHSGSRGREGVDKLIALAEERSIRVEEADKALSRISGKENCFAAAVFSKFSDKPDPDKNHVLLHHPGDSGNVGTILRTALGFGIEDIILIRPCVDVFDPRTVRATMGSLFSLRVQILDRFEDYSRTYDSRDLFPFMLDSSMPMEEVLKKRLPEKYTLIFGNEGSGLPHEFASIGQPVRIPSSNKIDSLNLSVAAAIGIYAFSRKES